MIRAIKAIMFISLASVFIVLMGCATSANYQSMMVRTTPETYKNPKLTNTIVVSNVSGGKKTNPFWTSQVENYGFKKALEESLSAYGYLANSVGNAKYQLDASLLRVDMPAMSFSPEVKSTVVYKITGSGINKEYKIEANGKAKFSDALFSDERFRIANERSVQENIREFLKRLDTF